MSTVLIIAVAIGRRPLDEHLVGLGALSARPRSSNRAPAAPWDAAIARAAQRMMDSGRATFRFATFGDEVFWTDGLGLDRAITGDELGGLRRIAVRR